MEIINNLKEPEIVTKKGFKAGRTYREISDGRVVYVVDCSSHSRPLIVNMEMGKAYTFDDYNGCLKFTEVTTQLHIVS